MPSQPPSPSKILRFMGTLPKKEKKKSRERNIYHRMQRHT